MQGILDALKAPTSLYTASAPIEAVVIPETVQKPTAGQSGIVSSPKKALALETLRSKPELRELSGRELEKWGVDNGINMSYKLWNEAKKEDK